MRLSGEQRDFVEGGLRCLKHQSEAASRTPVHSGWGGCELRTNRGSEPVPQQPTRNKHHRCQAHGAARGSHPPPHDPVVMREIRRQGEWFIFKAEHTQTRRRLGETSEICRVTPLNW